MRNLRTDGSNLSEKSLDGTAEEGLPTLETKDRRTVTLRAASTSTEEKSSPGIRDREGLEVWKVVRSHGRTKGKPVKDLKINNKILTNKDKPKGQMNETGQNSILKRETR